MVQIDECYSECARELSNLRLRMEQDLEDLSGCVGGELLRSLLHNTDLILLQLDEIEQDLCRIVG